VVAAPSFISFQRNSELTSLANKLVGAINSARGEAMKTGRNAYVVPVNTSNWSGGWRVYVDLNGNDSYDAGTDMLVLSEPAVSSFSVLAATIAPQPPHPRSTYRLQWIGICTQHSKQ
jgi:type IV fimbrial biogenesis protein FimT